MRAHGALLSALEKSDADALAVLLASSPCSSSCLRDGRIRSSEWQVQQAQNAIDNDLQVRRRHWRSQRIDFYYNDQHEPTYDERG